MEFNKQVNWQTHTGDVGGLWSDAAKAVQVLRVELTYVNDECDFGELWQGAHGGGGAGLGDRV